jgi:glycosyltransferase involved in cell wall biosynthesis
MIIGIDGNEANVAKRVGIGEYAYELLKQFSMLESKATFWIYLKDKPNKELPSESANWQYKIVGPKKLWTQFGLPIHLFLKNPKPDVFFTPTHYAPRFSPVPTVVSVMDLSYIHFPNLFNKSDLYQLKNWTKYSVKNANKVITISKSSKNDIIEEYHVRGDKVAVVYPGIKAKVTLEPHVFPMSELSTKYQISDNFILYVGTLQPRKNIARLIEAFSLLLKNEELSKSNLQLVIVGKKGWLYEEILEAPKKYNVVDRVKFLDFVPDDELKELYHKAQVFVLPSLYEGFGLPVLEAMQHDCPVITSNISSMPEAGGDAALYVDPKNTADIAEKIKKVITHEPLRKEMIAKGKKQVEKFSWKKSAEETLAILEQVASSK